MDEDHMSGADLMEKVEKEINALSHEEMARLYRFAPTGHKYFDISGSYWLLFEKRFRSFGGMTIEMSKRIGHSG